MKLMLMLMLMQRLGERGPSERRAECVGRCELVLFPVWHSIAGRGCCGGLMATDVNVSSSSRISDVVKESTAGGK